MACRSTVTRLGGREFSPRKFDESFDLVEHGSTTGSSSIRNREMFAKLLENPRGQVLPPTLQSEAAKNFANLVAKSHLKLRKPCATIREDSFVIIGAASYSPLELELLDEINDRFDQWKFRGNVYVFDIATCQGLQDLDAYFRHFPSMPILPRPIEQTPILAIFQSGQVVDFQQGLENTRNSLTAWGAL